MFMADWSVINHVTDIHHCEAKGAVKIDIGSSSQQIALSDWMNRKILEAKNNPFHWRMPYSAS